MSSYVWLDGFRVSTQIDIRPRSLFSTSGGKKFKKLYKCTDVQIYRSTVHRYIIIFRRLICNADLMSCQVSDYYQRWTNDRLMVTKISNAKI